MASEGGLGEQERSRTRRDIGLLGLNQDLLLTVVELCLSSSESVQIPPTVKSQHLILCQICRSLRRLTLTTPSLWTRFTFTRVKLGQQRDLFKEWLSRADVPARSLPISLENLEESRFSISELEEFVLPYSSRLFRLHLHLTYEALEKFFNLLPLVTFPHLTDFRVLCEDFQQPSILEVVPIFSASPLEAFGVVLGPPVLVRGLGISWARLKSLHLTTPHSRFFFPISWIHTILDSCRMLETCSIFLEPSTDPELPRLVLTSLKHLSIQFRDPGWKTQAGILGFLSLPSLFSLKLECKDGLAFNETCSSLKSFFHRSPNIQHLYFERTPAPDSGFSSSVNSSEVVNILTLLFNLRTAHLPKGHHTNIVAVLEAILLRTLCPMLESIDLTVNDGLQVVRVIQTLWREGAGSRRRERRLRSIKLVGPKPSWIGICEPPADEDPEITSYKTIIRELEEEGLVIQN
ncbi:hypothetical protein AN958_03377 [Leucoagaricus sp. SymC.cos]|nr:hypothetical protein AN958_03377 [Leucoagaricus sp. SymC.cos]